MRTINKCVGTEHRSVRQGMTGSLRRFVPRDDTGNGGEGGIGEIARDLNRGTAGVLRATP